MENEQLQAAKAMLAYQKMMFEAGRCGLGVLEKALEVVKGLEKAHYHDIKIKAENAGAKIDHVFVDEANNYDSASRYTPQSVYLPEADNPVWTNSSQNPAGIRPNTDDLQESKDPYLNAKADLAVEIRRLTELEAEKSNALAMAPIDSPQPYLCGELVEGRKRIETLWDQLYELERTGQLPAPPVPTRPLTGDELVDKELKLARIAKDLDSMRNIRQKASKALRDAAANTNDKERFQLNVEKYTAKIASCDAEIDRLTKERDLLLGR